MGRSHATTVGASMRVHAQKRKCNQLAWLQSDVYSLGGFAGSCKTGDAAQLLNTLSTSDLGVLANEPADTCGRQITRARARRAR